MTPVLPAMDFEIGGAKVQAFFAYEGQGLPMHVHGAAHVIAVLRGVCHVQIEGREPIVLDAFDRPVLLPANIPHEIVVVESPTVFMNCYAPGDYGK